MNFRYLPKINLIPLSSFELCRYFLENAYFDWNVENHRNLGVKKFHCYQAFALRKQYTSFLKSFSFKSFKIKSLHQTDIKTRRRKKNSVFPYFLYFFFFFYRLNITRSGLQKYELIANFNSFKKMRLYQTDIQIILSNQIYNWTCTTSKWTLDISQR